MLGKELKPKITATIFVAVLMSAVVTAFGYLAINRVVVLEGLWSEYNRQETRAAHALNRIQIEMGYGGFIHHFKNYVLRRDPALLPRIEKHRDAIYEALRDYDELELTGREHQELTQLRQVVEEYAGYYEFAKTPAARVLSATEFDSRIRVDDKPALEAISALVDRAVARSSNIERQAKRVLDDTVLFLYWGGLVFPVIVVAGFVFIIFLKRLLSANRQIEYTSGELEDLLECAPDAMIYVASDGTITRTNKQAERLFGYDQSGLLSMTVEDLLPEQARKKHMRERQNYFSNPQLRRMDDRQDLSALTHDGKLIPVEISLNHSQRGGRTLAIATLRDVTYRKQYESELRKARDELEQRVEQRTADLARTKEEAEKANQAKSEFLSRMSHELRTPMNAVLGFNQLLALTELTPEQEEAQNEISNAGSHLLELIDELLDLARIEAGRLDVTLEKVALGPVVDECIALIQPLAVQHKVEIADEVGEGKACTVQADSARLRQALLNLLSNAVKYSFEAGRVTISHDLVQGQTVRLKVADTGCGLDANQLAKLAEPFERLGAEHTEIEGTGIGLVITRKLMELMGGKLGVESKPGKGSTFWLELALDESAGGVAKQSKQGATCACTEAVSVQNKHKTILHVEDNAANRLLVRKMLKRRADLHLLEADSGERGLELARTHKPDLILLDIKLPGMDGYEVLEKLQRQSTTRQIPVIAVSANAMPDDIKRGLAAGFKQYLSKPFDMHKIFDALGPYCDDCSYPEKVEKPAE